MQYRNFGRTGKKLSVITLGGMRYLHGWDEPRDELPPDSLANCYEITKKAFSLGINHIETAHGYKKSEGLYGRTLAQLDKPRSDYYLMTKGNAPDYDAMMRVLESQLKTLQTDYFDFYGYHGLNNRDIFNNTMSANGPWKAIAGLRDQGVIKHAGFSGHGPLDVLLDAVATDEFEFMNLHYFYFFQRNYPAVAAAGLKGMGILIISALEKGGLLFDPPEKLKKLTSPLTPVQFNGRFCLSHPEITTLSLGIHEDKHFSPAMSILDDKPYINKDYLQIKARVDSAAAAAGDDFCDYCSRCLPCPQGINIPETLRMLNMDTGWGMRKFGTFRYNMFQPDQSWFPGQFADHCNDCGECLPRCHLQLDIP
ncbi:MAG TPA: aldo/keto reductase, partial [Spirochaetota bacterium]|nr:aldo/keto reductase [Spirochaetota bacterium]